MRLEHIFVGKPVEVEFNGRPVKTGIYKHEVQGKVKVTKMGIEGDQQADLTVHGGIYKAIYAYPIAHYTFWKEERPDLSFTPGIVGENLSVSGLDEQVCVGDAFRIGKAVLSVTTPRLPCFKLGIKMGDARFIKDFMKAERNGFYFKVEEEGLIEAGDEIQKIHSDGYGLTIAETIRLYTSRKNDTKLLKKAIDSPSLIDAWKDDFEVRLRKMGV